MPKVVDHEERRHELAEAAWGAIVKYGLDGTTTRLIAKESGYSAGVLAHYFESKDEILLEALRISHDGLDKRIREAVDDQEGFGEMSIWSRALVNDELRSVQRSESSRWRRFVEGLIVGAQRSGELVEMPPRTIAVLLSAVIDGLSIYGLLYPDRFGKAELIDFLDQFLATLRPDGVKAHSERSGGSSNGSRPRSQARSRK